MSNELGESRKAAFVMVSPELIGTLLGLPSELKVQTAYYDNRTNAVCVVVEGDSLNDVPLGYAMPAITPVYQRQEDGAVVLTKIIGYPGVVPWKVVRCGADQPHFEITRLRDELARIQKTHEQEIELIHNGYLEQAKA